VTIQADDSVTFDVGQGDRGPIATNVSLDDSGETTEEAPAAEEEVSEDVKEE